MKNTCKRDKYQLNALVRRSIQVYVKVYFIEMTEETSFPLQCFLVFAVWQGRPMMSLLSPGRVCDRLRVSRVWSERGNIGSHLSHESIYKHTRTDSFEGKRGIRSFESIFSSHWLNDMLIIWMWAAIGRKHLQLCYSTGPSPFPLKQQQPLPHARSDR